MQRCQNIRPFIEKEDLTTEDNRVGFKGLQLVLMDESKGSATAMLSCNIASNRTLCFVSCVTTTARNLIGNYLVVFTDFVQLQPVYIYIYKT